MKSSHRHVKPILVLAACLVMISLGAGPAHACFSPDPNVTVSGAGASRTVTFGGSTFPPAGDPNNARCSCGLTLPSQFAGVSAVQVTDPNGVAIPAFGTFSPNDAAPRAFGALQYAGSARSWAARSSSIIGAGVIPTGAAQLRFTVTSADPNAPNSALKAALDGGSWVGSAQAGVSGGDFVKGHMAVLPVGGADIPTLSEWGMIALVSLLILAGMIVMMRRRQRAVA